MTKVLMPESAAEAVAQGAQRLDRKVPGWHQKINLDALDISNSQDCICGQLRRGTGHESWTVFAWKQLRVSHGKAGLFGFTHFLDTPDYRDITYLPWTYRNLNAEWKKAIRARLKADKLDAKLKAEKKELVPA